MNKKEEWKCSEKPIAICAIVKAWNLALCDVTRRQRPMMPLVSFALQRNVRNNATFGLFATASLFRLTGCFCIHLFFYSSKNTTITPVLFRYQVLLFSSLFPKKIFILFFKIALSGRFLFQLSILL